MSASFTRSFGESWRSAALGERRGSGEERSGGGGVEQSWSSGSLEETSEKGPGGSRHAMWKFFE